MTSFPYDATVVTATGEKTTLDALRDKAVLIVNVASKCGFTPQYEQLEELHETYGERGLQIVGFPCNQFGAQEPGSDVQIAEFCQLNYGVTFPVFAKVKVNGKKKHAVFEALREKADSDGNAGRVRWNFEKFLIAPGGEVVGRYRSKMRPDDPVIVDAIEAILPS